MEATVFKVSSAVAPRNHTISLRGFLPADHNVSPDFSSMTQLFGDERCTTAILEFLATTEVGVRGRRRLMGEEDYGEEGTGGDSDEAEDGDEEVQSEGWESEDEEG
jgi:hypothetical protein